MDTSKLKTIRVGLKLSIGQLAEKTGVDRTIISQVEKGRANTTVATLEKILTGLECKLVVALS
jgi:transcriptional regulator with XRE-family HTH domain